MDLSNLSEVVKELEKMSIHTTQGTFVRLEDVRRLIDVKQEAETPDPEAPPPPRTLAQARSQAKEYLKEQGSMEGIREPGRAVNANEPQPSSRT